MLISGGEISLSVMERFKIAFTAFIVHFPLAVFSFSVKLSAFVLVSISKARIILHYSHLIFKKI